jgi:uncharacterized OB-fold protein
MPGFTKGPVECVDGNWKCPQCANVNFGTRMQCNRCQLPKPSDHELAERAQAAAVGRANPTAGNVAPHHRGPVEGQDGNWKCLSCSNVNFANRTHCNRCGIPKPSDEQVVTAQTLQAAMPPAAPTPMYGKTGHNKGPQEGVDGNWKCFMCSNINFATRVKCHRCGTDKQTAQAQVQMAQLTDPAQYAQMAQMASFAQGADGALAATQMQMPLDPQVTLLQEQMAQMAQRQMQLALTVTSLQTHVQQLQTQLAQQSVQLMQVAGNMQTSALSLPSTMTLAGGLQQFAGTAAPSDAAMAAVSATESVLGKRSTAD